MTEAEDWKTRQAVGLEAAIARFKRDLPGWWYRVCECQVSADASCGPTRESEHIGLIPKDKSFDDGFHADLDMPSTMANALDNVREKALAAIERLAHKEPK